jgi:hypothetical protein
MIKSEEYSSKVQSGNEGRKLESEIVKMEEQLLKHQNELSEENEKMR